MRPRRTPILPLYLNFNPRTHVGCDKGTVMKKNNNSSISIHAPTWGATPIYMLATSLSGISIHAPTWGATPLLAMHSDKSGISIHAPTWGATLSSSEDEAAAEISIHAPTWGATSAARSPSGTPVNFNPRTHVGCDRNEKAATS